MGDGSRSAVAGPVTVGTLVIRRAEETDLHEIVRIERDSFADPWSPESFLHALSQERMLFLVAEEGRGGRKRWGEPKASDPVVLGYVIALVVSDEAEIADLAVAPLARRRGTGGLLLDRVTTDVAERGVRSLYLEVRESNAAGRALYRSRAFLQVGRRRGYYRNPSEDALLLKRDLVPDLK